MKITAEELSKLEYFNNISTKTINHILNQSEVKKYKSGDILFYDKEKVNIIYFVISGAVSLYKINENGQKKIIFILDRGKIINEVIIKDLPASINCQVVTESVILEIDRDELLSIMEKDFEFCKNVIYSLSMKTRRMYRQLKNTPNSVKIEKKLAAKIYKLGRDYGVKSEKGIEVDMDLTVTYLADLLGSPRETVSRTIKILQKNQLIIYENKRITIPNMNELSKFFRTS